MRINGIGWTLLGVSDMDDNGVATATMWFTFLFLPIFPLARYQVQFLPNKGSGILFDILRQDKPVLSEVLKTYLSGWVLAPVLILGPIILAVRQNWEKLNLPEAWYTPFVIFSIAWFMVMVLVLYIRLENRCQPKKSMNIVRILGEEQAEAGEEVEAGIAAPQDYIPQDTIPQAETPPEPTLAQVEPGAAGEQAPARKPGSPLGGILFVGVLIGSVALTLYWVIAQAGLALWLYQLQDRWFGVVYPFYTFVILWIVVVVAFALAAGLISSAVDRIQRIKNGL